MLFDLRGSGRRNTVRAIYLALAILMGAGLVLFGIGGATSGGLLDAIKGDGSTSTDNTFEKKVTALEKKVKLNPSDAASWALLAKYRAQEASVAGENYDQNTSTFTKKGLAKLKQSAAEWEKYLALNPPKPDDGTANFMVQAYTALNDPDKAVGAMEIVAEARPKQYALWAQLAQLAYIAGQSRKGDLSAKKAIELAPKDQKETVKSTLDSAKTQAIQQQVQQATSTTPSG